MPQGRYFWHKHRVHWSNYYETKIPWCNNNITKMLRAMKFRLFPLTDEISKSLLCGFLRDFVRVWDYKAHLNGSHLYAASQNSNENTHYFFEGICGNTKTKQNLVIHMWAHKRHFYGCGKRDIRPRTRTHKHIYYIYSIERENILNSMSEGLNQILYFVFWTKSLPYQQQS